MKPRFVIRGDRIVLRAGDVAMEKALVVRGGPMRITARFYMPEDGWFDYERVIGPNRFYRKRHKRMAGK